MAKKLFTLASLLFLVVSTTVSGQNKEREVRHTRPFVLGEIDEIQSVELSEKRILNIYLPEGYNKDDTLKYPVVYLLDGSAEEDFIHIVGLYQFNSFPWIHRVEKSIIVGIASVDRKRDFTYETSIQQDKMKYPTAGRSGKFIAFLENELLPFIENNYKTSSSKTIIGQSLGGLLAAEILFTKPALFSKYIIVSPSLWWDNASLLGKPAEKSWAGITQKIEVYVGVGKEGLVPGDNPRVMEVDANLLADKIKSSKSKMIKVFFDYLPQENHATVLHLAVFNALRLLNPVSADTDQ